MKRNIVAVIHAVCGVLGFLFIAAFWSSTLFSELFLSYAAIASVKQSILGAFVVFIPVMIAVGVSGNVLGGKAKRGVVVAKKKRMPIIALNGVLVLLPCAFYLNHLAQINEFGAMFYAVQALELAAGAVNLSLMGANIRDGLAMRKRKNSGAKLSEKTQ
ncbi:hypothetical protein B0181_09610 [Moraxella caviae]|uniref:Uncharacterized protein n=1 Tax=Moraxella caviae TaxID=34060 RepID=A0A1S9ZWJ5_9GAMM|nr:hypothetical protein [Moraxella caviae]OOR87803.1 hypothetical protein B0181_09610 [Moraxella caviae]STZ10559.1 Uncharacterised protein [Moraxella caviae]VEW12969.1 Uncharacterised protein [Moraxella caviae]